ncbi:hypothetical protein [Micromonospora sp. NBC_01813]|uniref:hypothetical protein n=1 Tax=Micromonospora sp. NBC_01813 TaxID=2975988 RepID=UPI002DDB1CF9|nr:hypothetical protein [Micromonospora sp. NBC_01813]WSA10258.1 hypothetical protein OG958_05520 [Micromonospora sp. NBC_01813]
MTGPLLIGEVGYRSKDDVVLRRALYEVWKSRFAFCTRPTLSWDLRFEDDPNGEIEVDITEVYSRYSVSRN